MFCSDSSWPQIYGTYGEFSLNGNEKSIPIKYLLTKMKPGNDGSWECEFASQLAPWREIFDVEELTFDELVQRDLDDSRVAHDLIPYLLSDNDESARFFPPILAVLAPANENNKGIADYYPSVEGEGNNISSKGLFKFDSIKIEGNETPFGSIKYNRHKTKFIIVDGQHRAMAVLALHRQLTNGWGDNNFQNYYDHLKVTGRDLSHIELPVCVLFAPELNKSNEQLSNKQINLNSICREIFLAVNKNAKKVSKTREILLDDEDFAARMMRRTLTSLKERTKDDNNNSRIYSFAYGDDDETNKQVLTGKFEYSTAVFLHKLHLSSIFASSEAYRFDKKTDITDGRRLKNSERASELLLGTSLQDQSRISRLAGKQFTYPNVKEIVKKLGDLTDSILLPLYDTFIPFKIQNQELRKLRTKLLDSNSRSDLVQRKCYSLLFEGSGAKTVFEAHRDRLKKIEETEGKLTSELFNQKDFIDTVDKALSTHENKYKLARSFTLFNFDANRVACDDFDEKAIRAKAKTIFDTTNTQAFQLGFLMSIQSIIEQINIDDLFYNERLNYTSDLTNLFVSILNYYFSDRKENKRTKFKGYFFENRSNVFSTYDNGLRRLLQLSGTQELNEKQWHFFRYAILEVIFSEYCKKEFELYFNNSRFTDDFINLFTPIFEETQKYIESYRNELVEKAVERHLSSPEFEDKLEERTKGVSADSDLEQIREELTNQFKKDMENLTSKCIDASLKKSS